MVCVSLFAMGQTPKVTFQAVVRDANNNLVINKEVSMDVIVTYGMSTYKESGLTAVTNANGLMSLLIGNAQGFDLIDWTSATITTVITILESGEIVSSTTSVTAVPYAIKTQNAINAVNAQMANDVSNTSATIQAVYTKIHEDSVVLSNVLIPNSDWNATSGVEAILNKPNLVTVATTGNYNDLVNTPDLTVYATSSHLDDTLGHYLKLADICDSIESNCTNVALKNADNTFSGNNTFTGLNTVPVAVDTTTMSFTLDKMQAVSYKDLMFVFDSAVRLLNDNIDKLAKSYDQQIDSLNDVISELTFKCGVSKVKDIDGNLYNTLVIGGKCWMRQNLRTTPLR